MSEAPASSSISDRLARLIDVRPGEGPALAWSWAYIFALLASYYVLRPIRDQMGVAGGLENLPWLFLATLVGMLALNLPFAWLVKRLPRARLKGRSTARRSRSRWKTRGPRRSSTPA